MNIEDLAKDTKDGKQPLKKKGYDDVEVSDLSDDDDKKDKDKQSKRKDVKDPGKKKPPKDGKNPKTLKKEPTGPATKTQQSDRAPAAADHALKNTQTPTEEVQPKVAQQQNIAAIPRHSGPPPPDKSRRQGCCVLM